jgi:hypothetical protein
MNGEFKYEKDFLSSAEADALFELAKSWPKERPLNKPAYPSPARFVSPESVSRSVPTLSARSAGQRRSESLLRIIPASSTSRCNTL